MTDHGRTLSLLHPRMKFIRRFCFSSQIVEVKNQQGCGGNHLGCQPLGSGGRRMRSSRLPWATHQAWGQPEVQVILPQKTPQNTKTKNQPNKQQQQQNSLRKMTALAHVWNPCTKEAKVRGSIVPGQFDSTARTFLKEVWESHFKAQTLRVSLPSAGKIVIIKLSRPGWIWNVSISRGNFVSWRPSYRYWLKLSTSGRKPVIAKPAKFGKYVSLATVKIWWKNVPKSGCLCLTTQENNWKLTSSSEEAATATCSI